MKILYYVPKYVQFSNNSRILRDMVSISKEWRKLSECRKGYGFFMLRELHFILFFIEYSIVKKTMLENDSTCQCIVPAVLISARKINI